MNRAAMLERAQSRREPWDMLVIGGGATGASVALDAASRGYSVLLVEQHDFGKGTSSRSTKLVHGGVRYLERGDFRLVMEALRERGRLLKNAPHVVRQQAFIVPVYRWWEAPFYGFGLKLYDALAWKERFGGSRYLPRREVLRRLPTIKSKGLRGGILYHDGQFDDSRLLIGILRTAADCGATLLNYAKAIRLFKNGELVSGARVQDVETGREFEASASVVINATGAFCDSVRQLADPAARPLVAPSQGTHLVFDRSILPCDTALMVPKTPDGRVMFAIPWQGHTLVGTTDVSIPSTVLEPHATEAEIRFILETASRYFAKPLTRADVKSVFAGIRPLVNAEGAANTAALSRDHTIRLDSGMLTITGGKWTTVRNMAEDCVNRAAEAAVLPKKRCRTMNLPILGGNDRDAIRRLQESDPGLRARLHPGHPWTEAEVICAARYEMARTVEDVLARRLRLLFLDAAAARAAAPRVAELLARELDHDSSWIAKQIQQFDELAAGYSLTEPA